MYNELFLNNSKTRNLEYNTVNQLIDLYNQSIIYNFNKVPYPSNQSFGATINSLNANPIQSNNYLLEQKLRNTGLYSKLKNKTIYSDSAAYHAALNKL